MSERPVDVVEFRTKRLLCRRWTPSDLDSILRIYGDRSAMRFVDDGEPLSEEDANRWLAVTAADYECRSS